MTQNYSHNLQEKLGKQDKNYEATPPVRASVAEKKSKVFEIYYRHCAVYILCYADFQKFPKGQIISE